MTVNMTDLNIYMYKQYTDKTLILYTSSSVYTVMVAMSMHQTVQKSQCPHKLVHFNN